MCLGGCVQYSHSANELQLGSNGSTRLTIDSSGQLILRGDGSDQTTKWHSGSAYVNAKLDVRQLAISFSGSDKVTSDTSGNFTFNQNVGIGGAPSVLFHCRANNAGSLAHARIDGDNGSGDGGAKLSLAYNGSDQWSILTRNQTSVGNSVALQILDGDGNDGVFLNQNATSFSANSDERMKENIVELENATDKLNTCLLYTSPSPRDGLLSRMPSSA